jgi:2-polyprenyl-3-methyl-5-hydroxy-6-metoxy-1,4-benzoquinol methylase
VYSSPVFTEETLQKLYDAAAVDSYVAPEAEHGIAVNSERYVKRLIKHSGITSGRLLDIGCGGGQLLQAARRMGFEGYGVEPSHDAVELARACGFNGIHGLYSSELYPENYFDLITVIHVIDHVMSPLELLQNVRKNLRPGGAVFIATHNIESLLAKLSGPRFIAYNVQHITYYTPDSLDEMLRRAGLKPIKRLKTLTTYSLNHLAENGISSPRLRDAVLRTFSTLGIGGLHLSFPFGNIEAIAVKE